jgi:protein-tyrosine kinase
MTMQPPRRLQGSLIERADELYGFGLLPVPVLPAEPPVIEHAPQSQLQPAPARKPTPRGPVASIDPATLRAAGLLVPGAPVDALAEEFRLVKRQLLLTARAVKASAGDRGRTVLVCSANPDEGKTYCALNLALSIAAERDTRVLLVDADVAKPDILARLGLPAAPGLLDILADTRLDAEAHVIATDIPGLSLLPAGAKRADDTELIASERTATVLAELLAADPARLIIFDSPPALAASPASVLAMLVGQAMLVVRADGTSDGDLRQAIGLLDGCEHIQLVLNAVSHRPGGKRFGSYYGQETKP